MIDIPRLHAIHDKYAALKLEIKWVQRVIELFGEEKKECEVCGKWHLVKNECHHDKRMVRSLFDGQWHEDQGDNSGIVQVGLFLNDVYISCVYEYCFVISNKMIRGYASQIAGDKEGFRSLDDAKIELLEVLYPHMKQLIKK